MDAAAGIIEALVEAGLVAAGDVPTVTPLGGGVSCDVARVDLVGGPVCVKQALARLRVAADWRAPVERSHSEVMWLRVAADAGVGVPRVIAEVPARHLFVMDYLDPATHPLWKAELAAERVDVPFAAAVGAALARVHRATAGSAAAARDFATDAQFDALRIDPFLRHTAAAHPDRAPRLTTLAARTAATRRALVHGDISPKNILSGPAGPVFLDAECAWYGDPAFDLAFCLTHLLLKAVWKPASTAAYAASFAAMRDAYLAGVDWEPASDLDARAADLVAALLLARVDGKSPAEYLVAEADRALVRDAARDLLGRPALTLHDIAAAWGRHLESR